MRFETGDTLRLSCLANFSLRAVSARCHASFGLVRVIKNGLSGPVAAPVFLVHSTVQQASALSLLPARIISHDG
jgi:hypothetical protein